MRHRNRVGLAIMAVGPVLVALAAAAPALRAAPFLRLVESECSVNALAQALGDKERVIDGEGEPCELRGWHTPVNRVANAFASDSGSDFDGFCFVSVSAGGYVQLFGGLADSELLQFWVDTGARNQTSSSGGCGSDPRTVTRVYFVWEVTRPHVEVEFQSLFPCESNGDVKVASVILGDLQIDLKRGCTQAPVVVELVAEDTITVDVRLQEGRCCNDSELLSAFALRTVPEPTPHSATAAVLLTVGWLAHRRRPRPSRS